MLSHKIQMQNKQNTMIQRNNQELISIGTASMSSWGDSESEQLHQCIDKIEYSEGSVEIVGLELLLVRTPHLDSSSDDTTRSSDISEPTVDSLYLTRERNPGQAASERRTKKRRETKPHNAGRSPRDGEVDSLILNREKLASVRNDRIHRRQNTKEKKKSKEYPQLEVKHYDHSTSWVLVLCSWTPLKDSSHLSSGRLTTQRKP
jgi:hypothetical protein